MNASSLLKNKDEIEELIMVQKQPDILVLTETRTTADIDDNEISFTGYATVRCDAENRRTGGVAIYIKKGLKFCKLGARSLPGSCWAAGVRITNKTRNVVVVAFYRSPSAKPADALSFLDELEHSYFENDCCICMGDFNLDVRKMNQYYPRKLIEQMTEYGMHQRINAPTRITSNSQTIIDLAFSNFKVQTAVLLTPTITDHAIITCEIDTFYQEKIDIRLVRNFKNFNHERFSKNLRQIEPYFGEQTKTNPSTMSEIGQLMNKLMRDITRIIDDEAPIKTHKIKRKNGISKAWFDCSIKQAAIERDRLYRIAIRRENDEDWGRYKEKRNEVVQKIREHKRKYYEEEIDNRKNDTAKMWRTLKNLLKTNITNQDWSQGMMIDGKVEIDKKQIANALNEYYIASVDRIITDLTTKRITNRRIDKQQGKVELWEEFDYVCISEISKIVCSMPAKKGTTDGISTGLLKDIFEAIGPQMTEMINTSLRMGVVPMSLKLAEIIPIPKIQGTNKAEELRPINKLSQVEKLIELIVKEQLNKFILKHDILSINQYGFQRGKSCEMAVQKLISEWKREIGKGMIVGAVFIDLKRAFETVNRTRLVDKLSNYGIGGRVKDWFTSYLTDREQKVIIEDVISKAKKTKHGVPQGSVLGPILFLLYINDITHYIKENCRIVLFADDMVIYTIGNSSRELEANLNEQLRVLEGYLDDNSLALNKQKTKLMVMKGPRENKGEWVSIKTCDGTVIEKVNEHKYLGVILDNKLTFKNHCDYIIKKVGKKISVLRRIGHFLSAMTRCTIFKTIIAPHLEYCSTIMLNMNKTDVERLQKMQNRGMRAILRCSREARIIDMLEALSFMSIQRRIEYNSLIFIYKMIHSEKDMSIEEKSVRMIVRDEGTTTRQKGQIKIDRRKTVNAQKDLFYKGLLLYNDLPRETREACTLQEFKRKLR